MTRVMRRKWSVILTTTFLTFTAVSGVQSEPQRPEVVAGDGVRQGGFFTAGAAGAVIAVPGDARIELDPGATVRVFASAQRLKMPEGYLVPTWSISVRSGRVRGQVGQPKKAAVLLTVSERFSTVVARGTGVLVVDEHGAAAVNLTGVSHTIVGGRWQALEEGTARSLNAGEGAPTTTATLAPPSIAPGRRVWVSTGQNVSVDTLEWAPVAGASDYTVVLQRAGEHEPLQELTTSGLSLPKALDPIGPGQYAAVLQANDARGVPGRRSEPVLLRVVGVDLPGGAYLSSGSIHMGPGQYVRFTHTAGLELAYTGGQRYVPANTEVQLHQGERTVVRFREAGGRDAATLRLEPRAIEAEVNLGPSSARWPKDDVEVSIRLHATSQETPRDLVELRPKVTVGIDPVQVAWHWEGSHLRGTVPRPSNGAGPWVIRVEVEDQFGLPLGRNVLEVAQDVADKKSERR